MTGPQFVYPEQRDDETGAQYWARVHDMGLPYEWERDKAVPPGPITVTREWALIGPDPGDIPVAGDHYSEGELREMLARRPKSRYTLRHRTRWTAVSDWQEVPDA